MLTKKGETEAKIMGTIVVMLDEGWDEKDIAEALGISRFEACQRIGRIANIVDTYMLDAEEWE